MKIGLFYGSTTCYTEMAAEKIQQRLGSDNVDLHNIKDVPLSRTADYQYLIFGISTWDFGELQEDWAGLWSQVSTLPLAGKTVALYGLGDQENYGEWFQDALGMLFQELLDTDCQFVGFWPRSEDYHFTQSKAVTDDGQWFVGLALDDDSQFELTDQRIEQWCSQLELEWAAD